MDFLQSIPLTDRNRTGKSTEVNFPVASGTYPDYSFIHKIKFEGVSPRPGQGGAVISARLIRYYEGDIITDSPEVVVDLFEESAVFNQSNLSQKGPLIIYNSFTNVDFMTLSFDPSDNKVVRSYDPVSSARENFEKSNAKNLQPTAFQCEEGSNAIYAIVSTEKGFTLPNNQVWTLQLSISY
jgi:hypothetical protein